MDIDTNVKLLELLLDQVSSAVAVGDNDLACELHREVALLNIEIGVACGAL